MAESARIAAVDLNGQLRGKRLAANALHKTARMPLSVLNVDIRGADIADSPLVFKTGDQDGLLIPTGRGPVPLPWVSGATLLQPCTMHYDNGDPYLGDPRHALSRVLERYKQKGQTVIAACELEFYLLEKDRGLTPPKNPKTRHRLSDTQILSLRELDSFDRFFDDICAAATKMGVGDLIITDEAGIGQFEITMQHGPALKAADDVIFLKELIKGTAHNHNLTATFAAKPFEAEAGNGLHTHFSVIDNKGQNIFCEDAMLHSAIAGALNLFRASTLFFAPFQNSYARFVKNAHAPTSATWGHENRTVALRVPGGEKPARRIEHRVAGGDVNPYLLFAAIFGAAFQGMENNTTPPPPITGNAYDLQLPFAQNLHSDLGSAICALNDPALAQILPQLLLENLAMTKAEELQFMQKKAKSEIMQMLIDAL